MAVRKYVDVTSPVFTDEQGAGADETHTHYVITNAAGTIVKTKPKQIMNQALSAPAPFTLSAGQRAEVKGIFVESPEASDIPDDIAADDLDAKFVDGDKIQWRTDASTPSARLAPTAITWEEAATV
jgi:hypothetical protein